MKVLLITPLPPAVGGIARWSESFLQWADGRFETTVVNNALLKIDGSLVTKYVSQIKRTRNILRDLSRKIKQEDIDVAHINSSCGKLGILRDYVCVKKLVKNHIPVVFQCHCNIEDQIGNDKLANRCFKKIIRLVSKMLVLNTTSLKFAQTFDAQNVCICPNFIANEKIVTVPHNISEKINTAVYIGHLYRNKGIDEVVALAKMYPEIQFKIVGPMTREYNETTSLPVNVVLTGQTDASGVLSELDSADLFLLLSYSEGFSNALLEAMARGVPVLASDVGAAMDMIENKGGRIVPVKDMKAISQAVEDIKDVHMRTCMSQWNIDKVQSCYECSVVLSKIETIYDQTIAKS